MLRKTGLILLTCGLLGALASACEANTGKSEGDSCSSLDDCSAGLYCQPVTGHQGDFCCPTPADASTKSNCQAVAPSTPTGDGG